MSSEKEYLAIVSFGISGSYGRSAYMANAVEIVQREAVSLAKSLGGLKEQVVVKIHVYDITGHDDVWWDESGVHPKDSGETIPRTLLMDWQMPMSAVKKQPRRRRAA